MESFTLRSPSKIKLAFICTYLRISRFYKILKSRENETTEICAFL